MEAVKIMPPPAEQKPCVCGATLYICRESTEQHRNQMWRYARHCGARGLTYEGALRRKLRLDLLSWGDLKRKAQALIEADHEDLNVSLLQRIIPCRQGLYRRTRSLR